MGKLVCIPVGMLVAATLLAGVVPGQGSAEAPSGGELSAFDVDSAVERYLSRLTPEERERSDAYFEGGYWLQVWGFLYGLAVAWLLLGSGLSARMRDLAERVTHFSTLHRALYAAQYVLVTSLLTFPLTVYQGYFREHRYGLATQSFGPWLTDEVVGMFVGIVMLSVLFSVLYAAFNRAPRTWWLWGSAVGVAFLCLIMLVAPVYIDPLFNTYTPIDDPEVSEPILSLARASGIDARAVYRFDASRQSTRISANVSGLLGTMSIRLNDNLLARCSLPEIEAVMAHEIGHYALNHVYEGLLFFGVVLLGGFAFVRWSFDWTATRWGGRWGIRGISDSAGFPLLVALLSVYFFLLTPLLNTYVRVNEAEADLYGLNAARRPEGFAEVALKLGDYRKLDPGPFEEWIFFDHPSGRSRITMAMRWMAEQ